MRYLFSIIIFSFSLLCGAQMVSTGARSVRYTTYSATNLAKDPIFFYCNALGTERGTLTATRPGPADTLNYKWYKWNDGTSSFSTFLKTDNGFASSTISNLTEGGYKVDIDKGGVYDTSLVGWIFFDQPPVSTSSLQQYTCYRVALKGDTSATRHSFYYKDPLTGNLVQKKNEVTFLWSSLPSTFIPGPAINMNPRIENRPPPAYVYQLPLENLTFKFTVNTLGCSSESTFDYSPIHVKADFSVDPKEGEAPLTVNFTDKSIRATTYLWKFGDGTTSEINDPETHIYYKPGTYYPKLRVESNLLCADSTVVLDTSLFKIVVKPSELDIPNVFTPNDDGINDYFVVESKSLRTLSVELFSRSGLMVYSFYGEGEALSAWKGWDGKVLNTSAKAAPGVYYYIIRAIGWDDKIYDSKAYRGFFYLYK